MEQSSPSILRGSSAEVGEQTYGILDAVRGAARVCSVAAGDHGVDEWMGLLREVSQALTVLAAARDAAIVRLAAIDETVTEDGVIGEQVNGLGTVCRDAGAMVSTATGTSARFGDEMVEQAITRVVRVPALHEAMLEGLLDDYKARRLAGELSDVPPELARAVVDALGGDLSTRSGPALQRRARTILMSLCPDLLRERIRKARKAVGLRRWMGEPGTDSWGGSFPSERAATAWAAIDALARRYRQEGRYDTLEQARAYALMDLVDGNVTVETVLHLTVPSDVLDEATRDDGEAVSGRVGHVGGQDDGRDSDHVSGHVAGASGSHGSTHVGTDHIGTGHVGTGHVGTGHVEASSSGHPSAAAPRGRPPDGGVFVAVAGAHGHSISWFPVAALSPTGRVGSETARVCHPASGALLDPGDCRATEAYRPGEALKTLVRQRDGGCRFPGCSISARQCDLDHVVPWPHGPTAASNLICLCRRHHRVKQRHRWRVRLFADGEVEWADPAGRLHRTEPVDHLGVRQVRVIDADPSVAGPSVAGLNDAGLSDVGGHDIDSADVEFSTSEDLSASLLESWLALRVEHAVGGPSAARRPSSAGVGRQDAYPGAVTGEEIDALSRAVRAGGFATLDDAIGSLSSPAVGPSRSMRVCRVDHQGAPRDCIVKVRRRRRHTGDEAPAVEDPPF